MQEREGILSIHSRALPLAADVDLHEVASKCHGYSGADLAAVTRQAALHAMQAAVASPSSPESLGMTLAFLLLYVMPLLNAHLELTCVVCQLPDLHGIEMLMTSGLEFRTLQNN